MSQIYNNKTMTSNNTQNDKQSNNIDVNDSPAMNSDEMEMFLNVQRSKSDGSVLGKLFGQPIEGERSRPLIINIPTPINNQPQISNFKLFRKIRKEKKKNESDYCKNICGYITKKIIRELCSPNYANHVKQLCEKYNCQYRELKNFYLPKIQQVTGPSHIPSLLVPDSEQEQKIKQVFKQFFEWFIKSRYLRYLLNQGKMADKKAYIKYKNHMLLSMLNESKGIKNNGILKTEEHSYEASSDSSEEQEDEQKMKNEMQEKQKQKQQQNKKSEIHKSNGKRKIVAKNKSNGKGK